MSKFLPTVGKFIQDHSPVILAGFSVAGIVATAAFSSQAGYRARDILQQAEKDVELELKEKVAATWKLYIPTMVCGVLTAAAVSGTAYIGTRRLTALGSAYAVTERAYQEYRSKVREKIGDTKEAEIRNEVAKKRLADDPVSNHDTILGGSGRVLFYDLYAGRYFFSDMEQVRQAQNAVNKMIIDGYFATLSDLYDQLNVDRTKFSDDVGWNVDHLLEIRFSTTMADNNEPCITIDFDTSPIRGYHRLS